MIVNSAMATYIPIMPTHDAEWRRKVSAAQKRRWERDRKSGRAEETAAKIAARLRLLSPKQVTTAVRRMSEANGPTSKAMAAEFGVSPATLSSAMARSIGRAAATQIARARMADAMRGNKRGKGLPLHGIEKVKARRGAANPNWRGGHAVGPRNNRKYQAFRRWILERDDRKCTDCGTDKGRLDVHHIIPESERPGLLYDESNCTTLCQVCHERAHGKNRPQYATGY